MNENTDIKKFGRIAVLMGGYSSERDISLRSGEAIFSALKSMGADVVAVDIIYRRRDQIIAALKHYNIDLVFIALHGELGEDGKIQSILDELNITYTGSSAATSRVCINKPMTQNILKNNGFYVPHYVTLNSYDNFYSLIEEVDFYPLVVKPATGGSSIGMSLVDNVKQLKAAFNKAWKYDTTLMIEQHIKGFEMTVGVLLEEALDVIEIKPKSNFFDFTAKYQKGMTEYIIPAEIPEELKRELQAQALRAHQLLGCQDLSRIDFIVNNNRPYILEINTIPGFTETSLLPKAAAVKGINFNHLCYLLIESVYGKKKEKEGISHRALVMDT